jgi:hypothetical protein
VKSNTMLAAAVIGFSLVVAAGIFALVTDLLRTTDDTAASLVSARMERTLSRQQRDLEALRADLEDLRSEMDRIRTLVEELRRRPPVVIAPPPPAPAATDPQTPPSAFPAGVDQFGGNAPAEETEGMTDQMQLARKRFNQTVERPRPQVLRELVGEPRETYSQECLPVTNPRMVKLLETRKVAGVRLTMLKPALDSLEQVMERLRTEEPDIYAAIGSAGALCARYVRGSTKSISSHAWGAAVDLTLKRALDQMGDGTTQFGLVVLAEFFNDAGWYWGAGYSREDSMHFEVGEGLLRKWVAEGRL